MDARTNSTSNDIRDHQHPRTWRPGRGGPYTESGGPGERGIELQGRENLWVVAYSPGQLSAGRDCVPLAEGHDRVE